jgi:hypothetical protein
MRLAFYQLLAQRIPFSAESLRTAYLQRETVDHCRIDVESTASGAAASK